MQMLGQLNNIRLLVEVGKRVSRMNEKRGTCWVGYQQIGMKKKGGKLVPNCVKEVVDIYWENESNESCGYTFEFEND